MVNKSNFKDPIEVRPKPKMVKEPYGQKNMHYDERSSVYVNAGSDYGVGHKQPVGHKGNPKQSVDVLPKGHHNAMDLPKNRPDIGLQS